MSRARPKATSCGWQPSSVRRSRETRSWSSITRRSPGPPSQAAHRLPSLRIGDGASPSASSAPNATQAGANVAVVARPSRTPSRLMSSSRIRATRSRPASFHRWRDRVTSRSLRRCSGSPRTVFQSIPFTDAVDPAPMARTRPSRSDGVSGRPGCRSTCLELSGVGRSACRGCCPPGSRDPATTEAPPERGLVPCPAELLQVLLARADEAHAVALVLELHASVVEALPAVVAALGLADGQEGRGDQVADAVLVEVLLVGVGLQRRIVFVVWHAVVVVVEDGVVADAVAVVVRRLALVERDGVLGVVDAIVVVVGLGVVADPVVVGVERLALVEREGVLGGGDAVVVVVCVGVVPDAIVVG